MYRTLLFSLALLGSLCAQAQKGTVTGTITAPEAGKVQPMPFVNVLLKGTTAGATTDLDGRFSFEAEPGAYTLLVSFVGYEPVERPVTVTAGQTVRIDVELKGQGIDMEEFEVVQVRDREAEGVMLMERREATTLVQNIGAQELRKKGASDVAEGVQKMVGLSTVGGRYLVVRGLGDRYNSAYLNGLPLPSPDPDTKVLPLDLFPTDIVERIAVTKAFSPELYGDFSGGAVDIATKRATGKSTLKVSLGSGMNTRSTFQDFRTYNGGATDRWGIDDGTRAVPNGVLAQGSTINGERSPFPINFSPTKRTASPDLSFGIYGGTSVKLAEEVKLHLTGTINHRNEYRYRSGALRIINTANTALIDYTSETWSYNTQSSALGSLALDLGRRHTIGFNAIWLNLSSDDVRLTYGSHFDYQDMVYARRFTFRENRLFTQQVFGRHAFGIKDRLVIDWSGSSSAAKATEPDRRQLVYLYNEGDAPEDYRFNAIDRLENHRWYSGLVEDETAAQVAIAYRLIQQETEEGFRSILTLRTGGQVKRKKRDFGYDIFSFNLQTLNAANPDGINVETPDAYLNNTTYGAGLYSINNVTGPEADHFISQDVNAAFMLAEYDIVPGKVKLMGGARLEMGDQQVIYRRQSDSFFQPKRLATITSTDVLPYAAVKWDLNKTHVVRINASKTLSRPGFREMAPFEYTEFFAGTKNIGNPELRNGTNYNADVRYEHFPAAGELFAVGAFGKQLIDPIEKVALATASGQLQSFRNTGSAQVMGIELEYVRNIGRLVGRDSSFWNDLSVGMNAALLHSELRIGEALTTSDGAAVVLTNEVRPLQGAAPYQLNFDLSYGLDLGNERKGTITLAYNVNGPRLFAAGANGLGDQYELPVNTLNLTLRADLSKHWQANIGLRNLLDAPFRVEQETPNGTTLISDFRIGTSISAGISYLLN